MRVVYFTHSLVSCWNHGNAHFLRGVLRALISLGHEVVTYEPKDAWSRANLVADHGMGGTKAFERAFPDLAGCVRFAEPDTDAMLDGADLVIVHEWNEPSFVRAVGRRRAAGGQFSLLFHDTHHRAVSDPATIERFDLSGYDGVLAFGEALAAVYRRRGVRVFVWHEAADIRLFHPPEEEGPRTGAVWIGNWGDDERSAELRDYLLRPTSELGISLDIHGVRYPAEALAALRQYSARYQGWLPNASAPEVLARHLLTVHVPRRYYATHLPGIPTIRVFESLACGIPLLSAPWQDSEGLFTPGTDFLMARHPADMTRMIRDLVHDPALRASLATRGLATIRACHTCDHRADELLRVVARLQSAKAA